MSGVLASGAGRSGPLSTEPSVGVSTEYASNPYLLSIGARPENDEAILLSAPTHYDLDSTHFAVTPSIRYSSSGTYASLASNYYHLNGSAALTRGLDTFSLTAAVGRDSSLQQNGLSSNGVGVRSDSTSAGLDWQRALTERATLDLDAGWSRVLYNQGGESTGLVDYRYISGGPTIAYATSERNKIQLSAIVGQYLALDGNTESRNYSVQLGFNRQLSETWTLSAGGGYARSDNTEELFVGPFFIGSFVYGPFPVGKAESRQQGPVYSVNLARPGERFSLAVNASRSYLPSGFQYLSRQDLAELDLAYTYSERWKFGAKIKYQETATPVSGGELSTVRYASGLLTADWNWTPTWIVSLRATWIDVKYELPPVSAQSSGISLVISRQFLRLDL